MSLISSVPPNGTFSGPVPGVAVNTAVAASAAAGLLQAARPLIPSAVVASTVVPNYQEPRLIKTTIRAPSSSPSSPFAAQFLDQNTVSEEHLALFQPRTPAQPNQQPELGAADDHLAALRQARDNALQAANGNVPQTPQAAAQAAVSNVVNFATATAALATPAKPAPANDAKNLPAVQTNALGRKPGLGLARGASAYQLAEARNQNASIVSAGVDAIL